MKYVPGIWRGSYEHLKTMKVRASIPNKEHLQSALNKLGMGDCKGSVSPKLDKAIMDCDSRIGRRALDPRRSLCCMSVMSERISKVRCVIRVRNF